MSSLSLSLCFFTHLFHSQAYPHILPTPGAAQSSNLQSVGAQAQSSFAGVQANSASYPYSAQTGQSAYGLAQAMSYSEYFSCYYDYNYFRCVVLYTREYTLFIIFTCICIVVRNTKTLNINL